MSKIKLLITHTQPQPSREDMIYRAWQFLKRLNRVECHILIIILIGFILSPLARGSDLLENGNFFGVKGGAGLACG